MSLPPDRRSQPVRGPGSRLPLPGVRQWRPLNRPRPVVHTGPPPSSVVAWAHYVDGHKRATADMDEATARALDGEGFVWLGLKDPTDADLTRFANQFNLHPLAIEDAVEGHTRSKLEEFGDTLFMVISTIAYVEHALVTATSEIVSTGQIMIFLGAHFVLTVRRGDHAQLGPLRAKLELDPERLASGPWAVLYSVADMVLDDFVALVDELGEDVDEVESRVFSRKGQHEVEATYQLKRELIEFRRAVVPLGMPLQLLATRAYAAVPAEARAYFRELADHHVETREAVAAFDEVLSSILTAGLARSSVADNEDMRKISAWVAIIAVPTMIAGIYGMNFDYMPELRLHYGYYILLGVMGLIMIALYIGFKRNKWL